MMTNQIKLNDSFNQNQCRFLKADLCCEIMYPNLLSLFSQVQNNIMFSRRQFLTLTAISPLALQVQAKQKKSAFQFDPVENRFLLNQEPFQIRSGEMHPARIPKPYWRHRIQMAKAMGMNTIAIYVMWNYHEQQEGQFDFTSENRDIVEFMRLCQQEQLYVILRPGPYICGEWDLGGIPAYLLADSNIILRANSSKAPRYMQAVARYIQQLAKLVQPLMLDQGGPILMLQIENEFGSYSNDLVYLEELRQLWIAQGIDGPFYTEDGYDQLMQNKTVIRDGAIGLSGGESTDIMKARQTYPHVPVMSGELYPGWLTHWGDPIMQGKDVDISKAIEGLMTAGQSFNIYVIHGGSNFGFTAGANTEKGEYQPDITSYDYAAPINEQGLPTNAYHRYRAIICKALGTTLPAIPAPIRTLKQHLHRPLVPRYFTSIWDHLPPAKTYSAVQTMEALGQQEGLVLYQTKLDVSQGSLQIDELHDYATLHLNQTYFAAISRTKLANGAFSELKMHAHRQAIELTQVHLENKPANDTSSIELAILVEGMGRINYGRVPVDRKGIVSPVILKSQNAQGSNQRTLEQWKITSLPLNEAYLKTLHKTPNRGRCANFFEHNIELKELGDCYIDMQHWTKGVVWVNGHNLGRYWKLGPQTRLYCPANFFKRGRNQILIFDHHQIKASPIALKLSLEDN